MAINYPEAITPPKSQYYDPGYWGGGYGDELYWSEGFVPKTSVRKPETDTKAYVEPSRARDEVGGDAIGEDRFGAKAATPTVENTFGFIDIPDIANAMLGFPGANIPGALVKGGTAVSNAWSLDKAREALGLSTKGMIAGSFSSSKGVVGTVTIGDQTYTVSAKPDPKDPNMISVDQALNIAEATGQPIQNATKEQVAAREAQMKTLGTTPTKGKTAKGAMMSVAKDAIGKVASEVRGKTPEQVAPVDKAMPTVAKDYVPGYTEQLSPAAPVTAVDREGLFAPSAAVEETVSPLSIQDRIDQAFGLETPAQKAAGFFDSPSTTSTQVASLDPSIGIGAPTSQVEYTGPATPNSLGVTETAGYQSPLAGITDRVTSEFGPRSAVSTSKGFSSTNHKGMDFSAAPGQSGYAVQSVNAGVVSHVDAVGKGNLGKNVTVEHPDGRKSVYGHLENVAGIEVGQSLAKGASIGTVGTTGRSSAPHLHFEMKDALGKQVNPSSLIDFSVTTPTPDVKPEMPNATPSMISPTSFFDGPMSPAAASAVGMGMQYSPEEKAAIGRTLAGELAPSTLNGLAIGDPTALAEAASVLGTIDNRVSSMKAANKDNPFGAVGSVLSPDQYSALDNSKVGKHGKTNLDISLDNYGIFGPDINSFMDSYFDGTNAAVDTNATHYANPDEMSPSALANNSWVDDLDTTVGNHSFGTPDQSWGNAQGFGESFGPVGGTLGPDTQGLSFDNDAAQSYTDARDEQYADLGGLMGSADLGGPDTPSDVGGMDTVEKAEAAAAEQSDKANDTGQEESKDGAEDSASEAGSSSSSGGGFGDNDDDSGSFGGSSLF